MRYAAALMALVLGGCVNLDPAVMIMGRDSGDMGSGGVKNILFGNSGPIEITLRDQTYTGTWVAVRNPGSTQFNLLSLYSTTGVSASGSSVGLSQSDAGYGTAMLSSTSGDTLHCEYRYSVVTATATGVCRNKSGEVFDLQVG
jgi:hypothetical protein